MRREVVMQHLDGVVLGGGLLAALILAGFAIAGSRGGPLDALRNRLRARRELRASRRRADVLARIELQRRRPE
jgi:hypothetical protein